VVGILRKEGSSPSTRVPGARAANVFRAATSLRRVRLSDPPSAFEAWRRLCTGTSSSTSHGFPGANLYDIAKLVEEKDLAKAEAFLATAASPPSSGDSGSPGERGRYLFPDSYIFVKPITPEEISSSWCGNSEGKFPGCGKRRRSGPILHQVVTIASIIEKETGSRRRSRSCRRSSGTASPSTCRSRWTDGDLRVKRFDGR